MTLGLAGVLADARALWRSERDLLLPIAGMFFVVPMLAIILLLADSGFADVAPEKLREAVMAFYVANLVPILLANLAIEFGTFATLNLYLQGGGRTLGEVLLLTLRRFLPWLAIDITAALLFSFGSSLFLLRLCRDRADRRPRLVGARGAARRGLSAHGAQQGM
jgi:hypothetical protein